MERSREEQVALDLRERALYRDLREASGRLNDEAFGLVEHFEQHGEWFAATDMLIEVCTIVGRRLPDELIQRVRDLYILEDYPWEHITRGLAATLARYDRLPEPPANASPPDCPEV